MNKYWFKRRRYGFGWTPVTWQGWTVVLAYLAVVLIGAWIVVPQSDDRAIANFQGVMIISTIILITISYLKGPLPRWRMGKSEEDDPETDF